MASRSPPAKAPQIIGGRFHHLHSTSLHSLPTTSKQLHTINYESAPVKEQSPSPDNIRNQKNLLQSIDVKRQTLNSSVFQHSQGKGSVRNGSSDPYRNNGFKGSKASDNPSSLKNFASAALLRHSSKRSTDASFIDASNAKLRIDISG